MTINDKVCDLIETGLYKGYKSLQKRFSSETQEDIDDALMKM